LVLGVSLILGDVAYGIAERVSYSVLWFGHYLPC
jgi:hypothetical protein